MEPLLIISDLLGSSCFNLLLRNIEKNGGTLFPFKSLASFIRNADDLSALFLLCQTKGLDLHTIPDFLELTKKLSQEKSLIILYEFQELNHFGDAHRPANDLHDFLMIREKQNRDAAENLLKDFFSDQSPWSHQRQCALLRAWKWTRDPLMQSVLEDILPHYDSEKTDFVRHLGAKQEGASEILLIASTLPLIAHHGIADRLRALLEESQEHREIQEFLVNVCHAFLRDGDKTNFQSLLTTYE